MDDGEGAEIESLSDWAIERLKFPRLAKTARRGAPFLSPQGHGEHLNFLCDSVSPWWMLPSA
jgi:hypothetical protein